MENEKMSYQQVQEIARELTEGYSLRGLPSSEDVAWAFPVEGQVRTHYNKAGYMDRIPNTQEGNAMRQIMTFKNFHNVLQYLREGKTIFNNAKIPNHCAPCGDADDGAYMIYPYMKQEDLGKESKTENGFFLGNFTKWIIKGSFQS